MTINFTKNKKKIETNKEKALKRKSVLTIDSNKTQLDFQGKKKKAKDFKKMLKKIKKKKKKKKKKEKKKKN